MMPTTLPDQSLLLHATSKPSSSGSSCTIVDGSGGNFGEMVPAPTLVGVHDFGITFTI